MNTKSHQTGEPRGPLPSGGKTPANQHVPRVPVQPTAAKQLIAVTAARIFTKSLLNVVFFMFVISF